MFVCGLRRPRCWHVRPALTRRQLKQCNKQLEYERIWHRHGGREEDEHKGRKKRAAGDQRTGRKLGIFQQKRMRSVDLAGVFLADAKRSNSQWVTKSLLRLTQPHRQNDGCLLRECLGFSVCGVVEGVTFAHETWLWCGAVIDRCTVSSHVNSLYLGAECLRNPWTRRKRSDL